jgi:hypothetical protein
MMRDIIATPVEIVICPYTVVFLVKEGTEQEINRAELAKFVDITFCVIDVETREEIYTEPITYSMN